jgi:manganese/iron transport system substrate-binding protein
VYKRQPHAWFDVHRAAIYVKNILAGVQSVDPANATRYQARCDHYLLQLRELDCWIRQQVNAIPQNRRILVTHHDAFRYFCSAYGFRTFSPLSWTTGELTDVSIHQRQFIIQQIRSLGVKSLFVESTINRELLNGIAQDAGVSIGGELYSDAMGPLGSGAETYIDMMRHNVKLIVRHLK